jgi:6-pyruvoyltetrahydropterin/6-carboxytetrahydropterin synthase
MERIAQITCEFTFEASHRLRRADWPDAENEAVFGNCARLHGHSYRLLVSLRGPIDPATGMVLNFRDVKQGVKEQVISRLDHQHLDDVVGELTTAENLCYWIARQLQPEFGDRLCRVELWETRTAFAALTEAELASMKGTRPVKVEPVE